MTKEPYNPLDKLNIARSIETELLNRAPVSLSDTTSISGAGVYAIYYTGRFAPYTRITEANADGKLDGSINAAFGGAPAIEGRS